MYQKLFSTKNIFLFFVFLLPASVIQAADTKSTSPGASTQLSKDESTFVKEAAEGGMMEVQLASWRRKRLQTRESSNLVRGWSKTTARLMTS